MQFIEQYRKGLVSTNSYILTISLILFSFVVGNTLALGLVKWLNIDLFNASSGGDKNLTLLLMLVPFVFLLGTLILCIKFIHKRSITSLFTSRDKFDWKRFFLSFGIFGLILSVSLAIALFSGVDVRWNMNASTFIPLLLVSFLMLPLQTAAEDALFRGYLFQGLGRLIKHGGISILISGVLFGLLHGANPEVAKLGYGLLAFYILSGIFLGILTHMDDGMELGMGYHAVNNIFAAVVLTNNWQAFTTDALFVDRTPPEFGWESILTLIVIQPLLILIFARIYKWKNWKQKILQKM